MSQSINRPNVLETAQEGVATSEDMKQVFQLASNLPKEQISSPRGIHIELEGFIDFDDPEFSLFVSLYGADILVVRLTMPEVRITVRSFELGLLRDSGSSSTTYYAFDREGVLQGGQVSGESWDWDTGILSRNTTESHDPVEVKQMPKKEYIMKIIAELQKIQQTDVVDAAVVARVSTVSQIGSDSLSQILRLMREDS